MEPTRQQIIDEIIREAHEDCDGITSKVKVQIVAEVEDLLGAGKPWTPSLLRTWAEIGARTAYTDWRRRHMGRGKTRKGTELDVPEFAAVRRIDENEVVYQQRELDDLTLEEVLAKAQAVGKQRDTLSVRYRYYADLAEIMASDPTITTVREARERLAAA